MRIISVPESLWPLAATLLLLTGNAHAAVIVNGSFEQPVISGGFALPPTIPGWSIAVPGTGPFEIQRNGVYGPLSVAAHGQQWLELDVFNPRPGYTAGGVFQDVSTVVGQTYILTFQHASRPSTPIADNILGLRINGVLQAVLVPPASQTNGTINWVTRQQIFTATTATTRIEFVDAGTSNGVGTLLDNVQIGEVPEPASLAIWSLFGVAVVGRGWRWRRGRRVA